MTVNSFNLLDEKWIKVVDHGLVSLTDIFQNRDYENLGGDVLEKLSVFKFLLAVSQAAYTPNDFNDWNNYSTEALSNTVLEYLRKNHDLFYLYGDKPFLQFPQIEFLGKKELKSYSTILSYEASGNTTVRTQIEAKHIPSTDEIARLLLIQMNFAFGGKQVDNSIVLSKSYKGKSKSGKVGTGLSYFGYLHSYFSSKYLLDTIRMNLLSSQDIASTNMFSSGVGIAPWEKMPTGEDDDIANEYKNSLMGRLISLGRFCLLKPDGLYLTEGLSLLDHTGGQNDPAVTVRTKGDNITAVWTDTEKRSWREITSLLSFVSNNSDNSSTCYQLKLCGNKVVTYGTPVGLWTLGIKVTKTSVEFRVAGRDDSVESRIEFENITEILNENWFTRYSREISALEKTAFKLTKSVEGYYSRSNDEEKNIGLESKKGKKAKDSGKRKEKKDIAKKCLFRFWDNCETLAKELQKACLDDEFGNEWIRIIRKKFAALAKQCYDEFCPALTARQIQRWAENRIHTAKYERMED
ncbi:type I-E CRISPR-associated protein Cse1/CasA [Succinivibrio sp.]|uniref:type I-E CRISPR-associated protein Cse1/CasA n=1 Tax=Succinivibrio sp. TaxID=2053619 RepID=UPI0025EBF387|nr:type I-E CRISPR-associated protein Cse1/CasA [Succinivibrio sp.]MBQ9219622.1 type I-E CRISPR-associated protein Cse1/CasA [Succinivibrio sp.]